MIPSTHARRPFTVFYFSSTAMELPSLCSAVRTFRENKEPLAIVARTQTQLSDQARQRAFVDQAMISADAVVIVLHGGKPSFPAWDALASALSKAGDGKRPYIHIHPQGSDEDAISAAQELSTDFGTPGRDMMKSYLSSGGHINIYRMIQALKILVLKTGEELPPAIPLPNEGIYHPDYDNIPDLEHYLKEQVDPSKPTAGLWFYQTYWVNNNLDFINAIIRKVEELGANVIPVFHHRYKDEEKGNKGADHIVNHYFMDGDRPRIQVLINPMIFSMTLAAPEYKSLLPKLNVPYIQAMVSLNPFSLWDESVQGMHTMDVSYSAAQPEFDGALITVPVATREQDCVDPVTGGLLTRYRPIDERVDKMVRLALNWGRLWSTPVAERRIAVIFHHYPPRNDRIGCAAGLDSFESVVSLLSAMKKEGYRIDRDFENGDELAREMLGRMTADRRWLTPDQMAERAEAHAGENYFKPWHDELPETIRAKMTEDWGKIPGELFVHNATMHFAGMLDGHVFLTIQPPRGYFENIDKIYHDMYLSPPHHYLAQYRWIRDVFNAHAVMHVGKHGSLEWLPGKALGLSKTCYPDLAIMELPNIYPYIINDPGEGTQAKRRSYACIIDHLTPAFTNADLYDDLSSVQGLINDYQSAVAEDPAKTAILKPMIWTAVSGANLQKDLDITEESAMEEFDLFLEKLHVILEEVSDTMINDGLHTLGLAPSDRRLVEFLVQLTRLSNGDVPSLRESVIVHMGHDMDDLIQNKGKRLTCFAQKTGGEIIRSAHETAIELVEALSDSRFDSQAIPDIVARILKKPSASVVSAMKYISECLVPNIRSCTDELKYSLSAFNGGFVPPGPSGSPSRGQADILPTGRNFYSVDPNKIPSPAAWAVGVRLGEALIERYLSETGRYPDSVGILVYGTVTMRTRGDDIAEILYLMGLKPVWQKGSGNVCGLEVIPLSELERPRIDVVPRVSGFFRDSFPNLMEFIDEAVRMAALLNEPPESNYLRRNVLSDVALYRKEGMSDEDAFREATFRVFGCPPGTYGAGVAELVESKDWKTQEDLGNNYIRYSSHAYGKGSYGKQKPEVYRRMLGRMDVTVKNEDSREYDMMSCTDYYNYYGGMIVAAKTVRGSLPFAVMGDSSDPERVKIRTTSEEAKHVLRARLINPKWLEGMKRHGYKGAGDISHMMDVVLGWDATAEVIEDWMYGKMANAYALDPKMKKWMKKINPHALHNILDKLIEAISRGMWNADKNMEQNLRDTYLDMEGEIEEWADMGG